MVNKENFYKKIKKNTDNIFMYERMNTEKEAVKVALKDAMILMQKEIEEMKKICSNPHMDMWVEKLAKMLKCLCEKKAIDL